MRATPRRGVDNVTLRAWKSSKGTSKKSFLSPSPGVVFHVWRTERGSKLKLGLLKCNQSPARACRRNMDGGRRVGCEGLADPRLFVHVGGAAGGDGAHFGPVLPSSPATSNALHRSVLQWETSHCNGKGNRCAEFVPLPLFSMKTLQLTMKRRYLLQNTSVHPQVPPLGALGCSRAPGLSLCNRVNRLSSQRMQGGCCGRGYVIPERKKGAETRVTPMYLGVRLKNTQQPDFQQW